MKIVDKEMFEVAQSFAREAIDTDSEFYWMCAFEALREAYGL